MSRASQCSECGCFGHHLIGCPEGERLWENANPDPYPKYVPETEEAETEEPFDAVAEIMSHFISIYGQKQKAAILSQ